MLRTRFFAFLRAKRMAQPETQLFFWRQFRTNHDLLPDLSGKTGLYDAFKRQVPKNYLKRTEEEEIHFTAYCCLLWDIQQRKENQLLTIATDKLFAHYAATLFPVEQRQTDPALLKRSIRKQLAAQWNIRPEIKESFQTGKEEVTFSLLAKIPGHHPYELITLQGKRLKPTRLKAHQNLLRYLEEGTYKPEQPSKRTPKKSVSTKPL